MVRPLLHPPAIISFVINVIAICTTLVASDVWALSDKVRIVPVRLKVRFSRHAHGAHDALLETQSLASAAEDNISLDSRASYLGFAGRQCANAKEWVWRKTVVSSDLIGKDPQGLTGTSRVSSCA